MGIIKKNYINIYTCQLQWNKPVFLESNYAMESYETNLALRGHSSITMSERKFKKNIFSDYMIKIK